MYSVKSPSLLRYFSKDLLWKIDTKEKVIYLTFDDGPVPVVTEKILDILKHYHAKATFFCLGKNVENHPSLFQRIQMEGHAVGNHTYNHVNGWKISLFSYLKNVILTEKVFEAKLFRPPYGKITPAQIRLIKKRYRIVMWHVISYDYDASISSEKCLENVVQNAREGSIVLFHDSVKASPNVYYALEGTLKYFSSLGYEFHPIC